MTLQNQNKGQFMQNFCRPIYFAFFCVALLVTTGAFGMESDKYGVKDYGILRELLTCAPIFMDHAFVCKMAMVSRGFNQMICDTAEWRKQYLEQFIGKQPNLMPYHDQYTAWHPYGSACVFISATEKKLEHSSLHDVNFCRSQLAGNDVPVHHVYCIMDAYTGPYVNQKNTYSVVSHNMASQYLRYLDVQLLFPMFDKSGNACLYYYKRDFSDAPFTEASINGYGILSTSSCMFEFKNAGYSLRLLARSSFLHAFINSSYIQKNGKTKTFMSDGVMINNAPLTQEDKQKIDRRINPKNIQ
jgi:hypothetical protein